MTLEDIVEKLFADNPDLNGDEAVKRLKEIKDPKTNKAMWKAGTIRNRVDTHLRKKEGLSNMHVESPVETKGSGSDLKIEGKEIERHKPKDPFALKPNTTIEEKVDQMKKEPIMEEKEAIVDAERFKREIIDNVSQKILKQVSAETKSFREETISIISDLKSSMVDVFTDIKKDMTDMQMQGLPLYEPIEKYYDLKLKESTINIIRKNTEEKELEEESEYINNLIKNEEEYLSISQVYHKLIDLAKEAKNGVQLRLFYGNEELSYSKEPVGRFGINRKNLIAGVLIGIPIGIVIFLIYTALTTATPPLPPVP